MANERDTLLWALKYISLGWSIIPLHSMESVDGKLRCTCGIDSCQDAAKHPRVTRGLRDASRDREKINEWFGPEKPKANIGLVTGQISGITVLDIDIGPGKEGATTWNDLNAEPGEPVTLHAITGGGGMHFVFLYNSALKTSSGTLGTAVDCRNDRGFICVAPSLHRSGRRYVWEEWVLDEDGKDIGKMPVIADLPAHLSKRKEKRGKKKKDDPALKKYTVEQVAGMLKFIKADDRDLWRNVGIILGREFNRADGAWKVYTEWSSQWGGQKGRNHDQIMQEAFHELGGAGGDLGLGTIIHKAIEGGWVPQSGAVPCENFLYFAPGNNFVYRPTGSFWPGESIDASCSQVNESGNLVKASLWLKRQKLVTSMTNDPELQDEVVKGQDCRDGVMIETVGAATYNAYRRSTIELGDERLAKPFVDHVYRVFPREGDADMFLNYMAHRVQKPGEKARFALLIGGEQGVGKDTAISMCYPAIGVWNVANIEPKDLDASFNEFESAVLVVISEAANTHEMSKWAFNERTKTLIAGLPDQITINPKYGQKMSVRRHSGVVVTTNHVLTGIYLPEDDRRYDIIDSASKVEMGIADPVSRGAYFGHLWDWFHHEDGASHIAALLHNRDVSGFNAATGQRITQAHKMVVALGLGSDDYVVDAVEALGKPAAVRVDALWATCENLSPGEMTRKEFNIKAQHVLGRLGFRRFMNPEARDGRWSEVDNSGIRRQFIIYWDPTKTSGEEVLKIVAKQKKVF